MLPRGVSETPRFCGNCGVPLGADVRFCRNCGAPVGEAQATVRTRPLWLVALLTFGSLSLYYYVWMARTWDELKRILKNEKMRPVWHALTQFVPIYSLFRLHAHFDTIRGLEGADSPIRVRPGWVVVAGAVAYALATASRFTDRWEGVLTVADFVILAGIATYGQWAMNAHAARGKARAIAGVTGVEWAAAVGAALLGLLLLFGAAAPFTR
jgi:hypothetical protein